MEEEIKFRAWDKEEKRWTDDIVISLKYGMLDHNLQGLDGDIDLMQYTGLKDKNGVEIYEGDIVKDHDDQIIYIKYFTKGRTIGFGFTFACINIPICNLLDENYRCDSEVIGNIYENEELIN